MSSHPFQNRTLSLTLLVGATGLMMGFAVSWGWEWVISGIAATSIVAVVGAMAIEQNVERRHADILRVLKTFRTSMRMEEPSTTKADEKSRGSIQLVQLELNETGRAVLGRINRLEEQVGELQHRDTQFQAILETMVEGVLVLDADRRVIFCNRATRDLLDLGERTVEGRPIWELTRARGFHAFWEATEAMTESCRQEVALKRNKVIVEVTASPLPSTPTPGTVLVLHDVTELRELERVRREFVSNVSHELKTPLTSIQAYAETLLESAVDDPESTPGFVNRILEQTERLRLLILDMLRLAKIDSQSDAFDLDEVSVAAILNECVQARADFAAAKSCRLVAHIEDEPLETFADREGLRTVFDNLINNALNYTDDGGRIDVRCHGTSDEVICEVEDYGIGIAAEHRERIFERFYRIDKSRSRGAGGTGLGLAIVKNFTLRFGGHVELESEVGQGSLFRIRLPRAEKVLKASQPIEASGIID